MLCWAWSWPRLSAATPAGDASERSLPDGAGLPALLLIALVGTAAANLLNNLPATLLLLPVVAPLGPVALLACWSASTSAPT